MHVICIFQASSPLFTLVNLKKCKGIITPQAQDGKAFNSDNLVSSRVTNVSKWN